MRAPEGWVGGLCVWKGPAWIAGGLTPTSSTRTDGHAKRLLSLDVLPVVETAMNRSAFADEVRHWGELLLEELSPHVDGGIAAARGRSPVGPLV